MHISTLLDSKYLKKADAHNEPTLTIQALEKRNVALEGAAPEMKWVLIFVETPKPLILNRTNTQVLARCFGDESDGWMGQKVTLYVDESVGFGGQLVGGVRLRAVKRPVVLKEVPPVPGRRRHRRNERGHSVLM